MSKPLLESDFITVDIQYFLNNKQAIDSADELAAAEEPNKPENNFNVTDKAILNAKPTNFDWGEELKARIAANRGMEPAARQSEYDIETRLFREFFRANWEEESAKQLILIGDILQKDIKILGFNRRLNPILAFLSNRYVQKELLQTKLINVSTYKAIHNAFAKKWIADSEFFKANDYNILYCRDLYKKPVKEIQEFLELQSETLKPTASIYTLADQTNNKKIFIYVAKNTEADIKDRAEKQKALNIKFPSMKSASAKLNSYELAQEISALFSGRATVGNRTHRKNTDTKTLNNIADKFKNDPAKVLAFIQYFSIITGDEYATKALSDEKLKSVSLEELRAATVQISKFIPQAKLSRADAITLIKELLSDLK